jgi:3-mercaptopyruvate sulfurtransferase SseA
MTRRLETAVYLALLAGLSLLVAAEGRRRAELERRVPVAPAELYRTLARSQTSWQVVDVRPDMAEGYEESHVPGAIPMPLEPPATVDLHELRVAWYTRMPGASPTPETIAATEAAAHALASAGARIHATVPTVIVTSGDGGAEVERCLARFGAARRLAGGMEAWSQARLPEDSGEYAPPSVKAGGGCL